MKKPPVMPQKRPRRPDPPLYIREWLERLGMRPADLVKDVPINAGYLSTIINRKGKYPGAGMLEDIAECMGIPSHYLKAPPPPYDVIDAVGNLDPAIIARLKRR